VRIVAIVVGAVLLIVAVRGTYENAGGINATDGQGLFPLLKQDFEPKSGGGGNFLAWFAAIFIIGALGYVQELKPIANTMLALVILVLLLSNGGFFAQLKTAVSQQPPASTLASSTGGASQSLGTLAQTAGQAISLT
jgi:hypothetical protein